MKKVARTFNFSITFCLYVCLIKFHFFSTCLCDDLFLIQFDFLRMLHNCQRATLQCSIHNIIFVEMYIRSCLILN